jgi:predicted amidophosphoribosyltransferase
MTALKRIAIYGKNPTHPQLLVCMRCMHIVEESDNFCWNCGGEFTAGIQNSNSDTIDWSAAKESHDAGF